MINRNTTLEDWLREVDGYHVYALPVQDGWMGLVIDIETKNQYHWTHTPKETYELAIQDSIDFCINRIKTQK